MTVEKFAGNLFMLGAIGVFIPYTILTLIFNYPDVLRLETATILVNFHKGGVFLILTWLAFALMGLPLLIAYSTLGKKLETKIPFVRWVTTIGIISGVTQIIGLLRWVFVVPVLATDYINSTNSIVQASAVTSFKLIHQFAGVLLGEHVGQLFTIIWTVGMSYALLKAGIIKKWLAWFGFILSAIYILAQAELFATIIPGFPVWGQAGLIGSSLWLIWLILIGNKLKKPRTRDLMERYYHN